VLNGEAANTSFIVVGFTRPGLEPTIYHTRGEHANRCTTDAVTNHLNEEYFEINEQADPNNLNEIEVNELRQGGHQVSPMV
jgi:hypothetical protein